MADIPIPPEAVEALREELRMSRLCADPATARAACLAMLKAWPGMAIARQGTVFWNTWQEPLLGQKPNIIILPMQENSDG